MFKYRVDKDIELKLPNKFDAEELYHLIDGSREHLGKWLPWVKSTNNTEMISSFIRGIQEQYISNDGFKAIITYNGSFAGLIGYHNIDWNRKCVSIGYWLGESFQGKEIMSKSLKVFIDYAFNNMNLNKIEIHIAEENFKSRALPNKFGFKVEGISRDAEWLNGQYVNHVMYGLIRNEWSDQ